MFLYLLALHAREPLVQPTGKLIFDAAAVHLAHSSFLPLTFLDPKMEGIFHIKNHSSVVTC